MENTIFQKFHALPPTLKHAVSSANALAAIEALEEKYDAGLAETIMRLMIKELKPDVPSLTQYFTTEQEMEKDQAAALAQELRAGLLQPVLAYLESAVPAPQPAAKSADVARDPVRAAASAVRPQPVEKKTAAPPAVPPVKPKPSVLQAPVAPATPQPRPVPLPASVFEKTDAPLSPMPQPSIPPLTKPIAAPVKPVATTPKPSSPVPTLPPSPPSTPAAVSPPHRVLQPAPVPATASVPFPPAPFTAARARYFVDAEDEEEVKKHQDRLRAIGGPSPTESVAAHIDALIVQRHLAFPSDLLKKRFVSILTSRLRDIRTREDVLDTLTRSPKIGGMGYDVTQATAIADDVDDRARLLHDIRRLTAEGTRPSPSSRSEEHNIPRVPSVSLPPQAVQQLTAAMMPRSVASAPLPPVIPPSPPISQPPVVPPSVPRAHIPVPVTRPAAAPHPVVPAVPMSAAARPTVEQPPPPRPLRRPDLIGTSGRTVIRDITKPRPMGLSDELSVLSIDDFRSLGSSLDDAASKVLEKIEVLAEESLVKRSQGIAAWRQSPVYQEYLQIGRQGMTEGRPVEQVIAARQASGKPTLSLEEFGVIADLNRHITY